MSAMVTVRRATEGDLPRLLAVASQLGEETHWPWRFSAKNAGNLMHAYISAEDTEALIAYLHGEPAGLALIAWDYEFSEEPIGYISKFYVAPFARGTPVARAMMRAACAWFDHHGCVSAFAMGTANIPSQGQRFNNLLGKFGFSPCAKTLVRSVEHVKA